LNYLASDVDIQVESAHGSVAFVLFPEGRGPTTERFEVRTRGLIVVVGIPQGEIGISDLASRTTHVLVPVDRRSVHSGRESSGTHGGDQVSNKVTVRRTAARPSAGGARVHFNIEPNTTPGGTSGLEFGDHGIHLGGGIGSGAGEHVHIAENAEIGEVGQRSGSIRVVRSGVVPRADNGEVVVVLDEALGRRSAHGHAGVEPEETRASVRHATADVVGAGARSTAVVSVAG